MTFNPFPVGKLPAAELATLLRGMSFDDHPRVVLGPGIGLDCAILDMGDTYLAIKSDPITFATEEIGWYAVHVNANDIATTGATPRWFLATVLLPEGHADREMVTRVFEQMRSACKTLGIALVGGHTEITAGLPRPVVAGTMLGEVAPANLITPEGLKPGNRILLTKGVPLEAASILSHELPLEDLLPQKVVAVARRYLHEPGISVVADAHHACAAGGVTAMHDPTEGGVKTGLIELAQAAGVALHIYPHAIPIPPEAGQVCQAAGIDPLEALSSGALLLAAEPDRAEDILNNLREEGIPAADIGTAVEGVGVWFLEATAKTAVALPRRDAIARLFEEKS